MNETNFKTWLDTLATTEEPQTRGALHRIIDDAGIPVGYCCLGVGCKVAGIPEVKARHRGFFGTSRTSTASLAPLDFIEWLGLPEREVGPATEDYDLYLDLPPVETMNGMVAPPSHVDREGQYLRYYTAAMMNDDLRFTFKQIADMFRYFGARV